jgi:GAF domain-containing protein
VPRFRRALQVHGHVGPGRVFGTLALSRMTDDEWTPEDVEFMVQVASQIAIAVENSHLSGTGTNQGAARDREGLPWTTRSASTTISGTWWVGGPAFQAVLQGLQTVAPTDAPF